MSRIDFDQAFSVGFISFGRLPYEWNNFIDPESILTEWPKLSCAPARGKKKRGVGSPKIGPRSGQPGKPAFRPQTHVSQGAICFLPREDGWEGPFGMPRCGSVTYGAPSLSCSVALFPFSFGGCPTKIVFLKKGSLFFQGH